jgi:hypothetical protein
VSISGTTLIESIHVPQLLYRRVGTLSIWQRRCGSNAFQWNSAAQMRHLRTFAMSIGKRYQELVPMADLGFAQ